MYAEELTNTRDSDEAMQIFTILSKGKGKSTTILFNRAD